MFRKLLLGLSVVLGIISTSSAQCSTQCKEAFQFVVRHEDSNLSGVVTKEPFGGIARFGVNSKAHPEAIYAGFYSMSRTRAYLYAQRLFYHGYWKPMHGDEIGNTRLAIKLADLAFNLGPVRATILLQRALNMQGFGLVAKGFFGVETLLALQDTSPDATVMLTKYQAAGFYTRLANRHLAQMRSWKRVWLERNEEG
jgi:lysozyme family protein